jgi:rubrerythrin
MMDFLKDYEDDEFTDPEDSEDYEAEHTITRTYVCEECDFRWTDTIYPDRNDFPDYEDELGQDHVCPMCGSLNVSFY